MYFQRFYDTKLAQASYLIGCQRTGEAIVVDPNRDVEQYVDAADAEGLRITARHRDAHPRRLRLRQRASWRRAPARTLLPLRRGRRRLEVRASPPRRGARLLRDGDDITVGNIGSRRCTRPGTRPSTSASSSPTRRPPTGRGRPHRRLRLRRRRRPAGPARDGRRRTPARWRRRRARSSARSQRFQRAARLISRSGRATAPARRAARRSARCRSRRSATRSCATGAFADRRRGRVRADRAGRPARAAALLRAR